jgi:hypothetical protein
MSLSRSNSDDNLSGDVEQVSVGHDLQLGPLRGYFALSVRNPQTFTLVDLSAPSDAKKEEAKQCVINVVNKLRLVGHYHLPATDKDFEEGYILFKIYMDQQSALLKEAYEKNKTANATLLYFQDATQNETKIENIKQFKSYIADAVFSGQELKKIYNGFSFLCPKAEGWCQGCDCVFQATGGKPQSQ